MKVLSRAVNGSADRRPAARSRGHRCGDQLSTRTHACYGSIDLRPGALLVSKQIERLSESLAGRYTIEREIGHGGMSMVYLGVDEKHDRRVAVKVIHPEIAFSISGQRFLREIEIAAHLAHPNIIPLLDSGEADGYLYHVTPYMEGETLGERLNRERLLSIDDAVHIAREIADALNYAHSEGIVHRDVKPENIMLSRGHALVMDFGVARAINVGGGDRLTRTGIILGTPAYMSPEQAAGERDIDRRSDIYALGCVVYEMLCGEPPLIGRTSLNTMARHIKESPRSIRTIRDSIHPGMDKTICKALSRLPADRFAHAQEFGEALVITMSGAAMPTPYPGTLPVSTGSGNPAAGRDDGPLAKPTFWEELKRRKVYGVGAVYVVAAVAIVGIAADTYEALGFPDAALRLLIYGAIGGFPVTLFLAWVFEITSEGIRRTQSIETRRGQNRKIGKWPVSRRSAIAVTAILAMIAIWQIFVRPVV